MAALHEPPYPYPLDPMERAAAGDAEGVVVIAGGTGTGKTHTLVARVAALLDAGARPGHVACLTARSESAALLRLRLERHPRTGGHLDEIFVGTIHECAANLLRHAGADSLGIPLDFTIWDHAQAVDAVHLVWPEYHETRLTKREVREALDWHWRNQGRSHLERPLPPRERLWFDVAEAYAIEKRWQNALDPEDLIVLAIRAMDRDQKERDRWRSTRTRHLLVDQAEEFTPWQLRLLQLMVGPTRSLMVATDPNQRVHRDAAPSVAEFLRLRFPELGQHRLRLNHERSAENFELTSTLNRHPVAPGLVDDMQVSDDVRRGPPKLVEVPGTLQDMYSHCLGRIQEIAAGGIPWEDMAVLYRVGGHVRRMRTQLAHRDIRYRVLGEAPRDRHGDARWIVAMLTCLLNPRDLRSVRIAAAPGYPNKDRILAPGSSRLLRRLAREQQMTLIETAGRNLNRFDEGDRGLLSELVQNWRHLDALLQDPDCGLRALLLRAEALVQRARAPGLTRVQDPEMGRLWRLCEAAPQPGWEDLGLHLVRFLDLWSPALHPDAHSDLNEGWGVTFGTIHAAKGRRWKVVFLLDVSDETMPGRVGPYSSRIERENRTFYTGVTRATEALYLYHLADTGRGNRTTPSRFLGPVLHLLERETAGRRRPTPAGWRSHSVAHDGRMPGLE